MIVLSLPISYWLILAIASSRSMPQVPLRPNPTTRFIIAIAAHNEASVIRATVSHLLGLNYPSPLFQIHIVADHCTDSTAQIASQTGAIVYERNEGPRSGKGIALSWLFQQIFANNNSCDALVIFDADTIVDPNFLRKMDARLAQGDKVIQGQHVISNPEDGWFPSLTWAMFLVDNRFQNLGRANLSWSAKNMGDSICFRADILQKMGWGEGLTEDYQLRQRLLLGGIKITYEPAAIGYGEAALTWSQAKAQRARWLRGAYDASQQFARQLLKESLKHRDGALLDGTLQAYLPSYSTLTIITTFIFLLQLLLNWTLPGSILFINLMMWLSIWVILFVYPLIGLALEKAPLKAYLVIVSGPFFILWRTWLAFSVRLRNRSVVWVRTTHGGKL